MQDLFLQVDPSVQILDFISETNFEQLDIFNDSYLSEYELQLYHTIINSKTYLKCESSDYINSHINMDDHLSGAVNKIQVSDPVLLSNESFATNQAELKDSN